MYYQTRASREIVRSMSQTSICDMFFSANVAMTRGTMFLLPWGICKVLGHLLQVYISSSLQVKNIFLLIAGQSHSHPNDAEFFLRFVVRGKEKTIFPSIFPGHRFNLDFDKRFVALSCTCTHSGLFEHEINFLGVLLSFRKMGRINLSFVFVAL